MSYNPNQNELCDVVLSPEYWQIVQEAAAERMKQREETCLNPLRTDIRIVCAGPEVVLEMDSEAGLPFVRDLIEDYVERTPDVVKELHAQGLLVPAQRREVAATIAPLVMEDIGLSFELNRLVA